VRACTGPAAAVVRRHGRVRCRLAGGKQGLRRSIACRTRLQHALGARTCTYRACDGLRGCKPYADLLGRAARQAELRVLSEGRVREVSVELCSPTRLVPVHIKGRPPSYFIYAGLVFTQARLWLCLGRHVFKPEPAKVLSAPAARPRGIRPVMAC
jgi:hypothetical protein